MDKNSSSVVRQAFLTSLPVMAGYIILGMGFGILLRDAGYGVLWAFLMSTFIYAGAMQFVGVGLIESGASLLMTAFTTFMVNARHLFYSISMIGRYRKAGKFKPYMIFALTDETYTLLVEDERGEDKAYGDLYRFLVSLFDHIYWITGSVLGSLIGNILPFSTEGIEFSMTALFIASFTEQWVSGKDRLSASVGIIGSVLCLLIFGASNFLIPDMILITAILTLMRGKFPEGKEADR